MERIWLKHYPANVPSEINPDAYDSIVDLFEKSCREYQDLAAFTCLDVSITYDELEKQSRYFAAYLQNELKLKKGDRVAIMLPNILQYPVVTFGALLAGLTVVNMNPLYTAPEVQHLLDSSGAETIIVLSNFAKTVEKALPHVTLKNIIVTDIGDLLGGVKKPIVNFVVKYIKRLVPSYQIPNARKLSDVLNQGKLLNYQNPQLTGKDIAFLQYTGGTTGHPKAAVLTHRNIVANVLQCKAWLDGAVDPGNDIILGALPLYHIFSLTVCCMAFMVVGGECLLIPNPRDMKGFLNTLSKKSVTIFIGLNTLFAGMLAHPNFQKVDFSRLKLTVSGGMATQASVAEEWHRKTGHPVVQGYGLTEASPVVSINPVDLAQFKAGIGLPVPSTDVKICDEQGDVLPLGEAGELCIKGPQVMQGYWHEPEETQNTFDEEGWLRTGDIAYMDKEGFIYIVDRKKDMILVSGFNVYPNEIEEVLSSHPDIQEVSVVGVPSEQTGEAIKAFIVTSNASLTEKEIIDYCHQSLTGYKIPRLIEFRDELPKSHVGKVLRKDLKGAA